MPKIRGTNRWRALTGEEARVKQTVVMQKKLLHMYQGLHGDVRKMLKAHETKQDLSRIQLKMLELDIENNMKEINRNLENDVRESMTEVATHVVEDKRQLLREYGFSADYIRDSYIYVPKSIVNNILNGNVYQNDWSLSKSIWGHTQNFNQVMTRIVAKGTATGKSAFEIAQDLEKYVNPDVAKPSRVIEFQKYKLDKNGKPIKNEKGEYVLGDKQKFYFGSVDYNAQRLARTMVSHAYQQSFMHVNEDDPFVTKYVWISALQHGRTCSVCFDRDGQLFDKDKLPLDHPNGMCTFEAYIPGGIGGVQKRLSDWMDAPVGTYPEIDKYADEVLKKYEGVGL